MSESKRHSKLVFLLALLVVGMFAFGFALVPIYNSICKTLGINGKTNPEAVAYDATKAKAATTAMMFSRTNTLLSIAMLYCMISAESGY